MKIIYESKKKYTVTIMADSRVITIRTFEDYDTMMDWLFDCEWEDAGYDVIVNGKYL